MALSGGVCDTRCQAFFTSVIEKENAMRRKWFLQNEEKLVKNLEEDSKLSQKVEDLKSLSKESKKSKKRETSREEIKKQVRFKIFSIFF